jgi:acetyl-CoA C-acetyltransferase
VRTAIGTFGGSLKDIPTVDLGAAVVKEGLARASVEGKDVGHVVFGHVVNTEPRDMYLARGGHQRRLRQGNAGHERQPPVRLGPAGHRQRQPGHPAGRLRHRHRRRRREHEPRPYASLATRFGARMGDAKMIDMMVGRCTTPSTPSTWA